MLLEDRCGAVGEGGRGDLAVAVPVPGVRVLAAERFVRVDAVLVAIAGDRDRATPPVGLEARDLLAEFREPRSPVGDRAVDEEFGAELDRGRAVLERTLEVGVTERRRGPDEARIRSARGASGCTWSLSASSGIS